MCKICPECNRIMNYDPYFEANICRQCGTVEPVLKKRGTLGKQLIEVKKIKSLNVSR